MLFLVIRFFGKVKEVIMSAKKALQDISMKLLLSAGTLRTNGDTATAEIFEKDGLRLAIVAIVLAGVEGAAKILGVQEIVDLLQQDLPEATRTDSPPAP